MDYRLTADTDAVYTLVYVCPYRSTLSDDIAMINNWTLHHYFHIL